MNIVAQPTSSVNVNTLKAALALAARGFSVVPLCFPITKDRCSCSWHKDEHKIGKRPMANPDHGYNSATMSESLLRAWWKENPKANVGIAVGKKYNLFCLDVDMHEANGLESLGALLEVNGPLPLTMEILSGGGGKHLYFRWPAGANIHSQNPIPGYPGLEIKADGGTCAPPSRHVSGACYEWIDDCEPALPPDWLIDLIATPRKIDRPEIILGEQLRVTRDESLDALELAQKEQPFLFVHTSQLARLGKDKDRRPIITHVGTAEIKNALTNSANFYKTRKIPNSDKVTLIDVSPPNEIAEVILGLAPHDWPFPPLDAIVETPVIRPDGSILDRPGYDKATRLYYAPQKHLQIPAIPTYPTQDDCKQAVDFISGFLEDFPFVSEADRANTLGLWLTTILRQRVRHVPLVTISANTQGAGKGLLTDATAILATGKTASTLALVADDEELEKRITALLLKGATMICFDNVEGVLRSPVLSKTLTSDSHTGRVLGFSKMVEVPQQAIWIANGNNIQLGGDMPRRCYPINMHVEVSDPWTREDFRYPDLIAAIMQHRGALIAALLTMARGWIVAEQPAPRKPLKNLATFTAWSDLVGGILSYAGIDGFLENLQAMHAQADIDGKAWTLFLETWYAKLGKDTYTTKQLLELWRQDSDLADTLPEPIATWFAADEKTIKNKIGKLFAKKKDRPYGPDNLKIVQGENTDKKVATFKITGYTGYTGSISSLRVKKTSDDIYRGNGGKQTPETPYTPGNDSHNGHHDTSLCEVEGCANQWVSAYERKLLCEKHLQEVHS